MKRLFLLIFICCYHLSFTCLAQEMNEYALNISKVNQPEANLHFNCSFTLNFQDADSVSMNFGGDEMLSIENLVVGGDSALLKYDYHPSSQRIIFHRVSSQAVPITMEYNYTNLSAFFIYGEGHAEIWETSYNEYYYPYVPNTNIDLTINIEIPDSLSFICAYPLESIGNGKYTSKLKGMLSQSLSLALIQKDAYIHTATNAPYPLNIYQISDMQCDEKRYDELLELAQASITYFCKIYGDEYLSTQRNITAYPTFLFHNGKGFSNRYNIGFISASQEKFSTYPNIYPLVHEIGYRWLGEWTLLIDDGEPGAYFIKESLNEFMTLMFIRQYYGTDRYKTLIEEYNLEYLKIKGTSRDEPFANIVTNNNNIMIYNKGPLVLDTMAREVGYENLIKLIAVFYQKNAGKSPLRYTDFINLIDETYPQVQNPLKPR